MNLPIEFEKNMISLLGESEFEKYKAVLDEERYYGMRANTLKISVDDFKSIARDKLGAYDDVPWCVEGLYYKGSFPGRHPYYHAGLFYIQEPSAMYPASSLRPTPGERVLDICAAPGGKTTHLAASLSGEGILVSNDISEERVKALVKNVELTGAKNVIITNETPEKLAESFPEWFDKILVDAPCSGEGMFRKDEEAVKSWENFKSQKCRDMQDGILESVHKMLKPGGMLLYSTCTFSPLENEQTVSAFMEKYGCYETVPLDKCAGIADAVPAWCDSGEAYHLENAARLWPHKIKGEGHFTVLLKKMGEPDVESFSADSTADDYTESRSKKKKKDKSRDYGKSKSYKKIQGIPDSVKAFYKKNMQSEPWEGSYFIMGTNMYYLPEEPPVLDGLKIARAGVFVGSVEYEEALKPSHPFAMALKASDFKSVINFDADGDDIQRYLKGETLSFFADTSNATKNGEDCEISALPDGYAAVCVDGYIVGLGKMQGGVMKNLYPKGWRRMR